MQQQRQLSTIKPKRLKPRKRMISVRQAAIAHGCSLKWIRDLLYAERLPGARKIAGQWFIPRSALGKLQQSSSAKKVCAAR